VPFHCTARWRDWITGEVIEAVPAPEAGLPLARVFGGIARLPFAVLVPESAGPAP
jgi:hypothetical protein